MLVLDISNYGGTLRSGVVQRWHAAGVRKVIVGVDLGHLLLARQQLETSLAGGMTIGIYRYCYWGTNPFTSFQQTYDVLGDLPIEEVWPDFEDEDAPEDNPGQVCTWIEDGLEAAVGTWGGELVKGLYTAAWWWRPFTDDTDRFSNWPLWVADYDGQANLDFTPFGGWNPPALMKQYSGSTQVGDINYGVDLNFCEESGMTNKELEEKIAHQALLQRWAGLVSAGEPDLVEKARLEMNFIAGLGGMPK